MSTATYIGEPLRLIEVIPVERPVPDPLPVEAPIGEGGQARPEPPVPDEREAA